MRPKKQANFIRPYEIRQPKVAAGTHEMCPQKRQANFPRIEIR